MPLNNRNRGSAPPARPQAQVCQTPNCRNAALKGKRQCSMCLSLAEGNSGTVPPLPKPKDAPPK